MILQVNWSEIIELRQELWKLLFDYWITDTLFSFNWWILLTTSTVSFIIWLFLLDKKRLFEIFMYGFFISTASFILDIIGITLVLWSYPDRIIPLVAPIIEIHKLIMPIVYMLVYQYVNRWKSFCIVMIITSFFFSFMLEPLLVWLGIYEIYKWKYIYSFPIYIGIGIGFRWLVLKLKQIETTNKTTK